MAFSNKAQLHALAGRNAEAIEAAERAIALGKDNPATLSHALNNLGDGALPIGGRQRPGDDGGEPAGGAGRATSRSTPAART